MNFSNISCIHFTGDGKPHHPPDGIARYPVRMVLIPRPSWGTLAVPHVGSGDCLAPPQRDESRGYAPMRIHQAIFYRINK